MLVSDLNKWLSEVHVLDVHSSGLSLAGSPNSKPINAVIMAITGILPSATVTLVDMYIHCRKMSSTSLRWW